MRDRHPQIEIIEVLSPDDALLDVPHLPPAGSVAPAAPARRRRRGAAAAVAVTVAIGGWIAAGGDDAVPDAVPDATVTSTTQVRDQLAPEPTAGEHFLFDSDVVRSYSADIMTTPSLRAIFRVWGTTSADRPWWSVQAFPGTLDDFFFTDAVRTTIDGTEIIQRVGSPTLITLRDFGDGWVGVVTTSGFTGEVHVRLANDLRHEGREVFDSGPTTKTSVLLPIATTAWESQWLYGDVETQVRGFAADGTIVTLRVGTGGTAARRTALPYFTGGPAGFTGDGVNGVRRDTGESVVIWAEGDKVLSLTAAMPLDQLEPLRDAVRPATEEEWTARLYGVSANFRLGKGWVLASGVDKQGREWSAGVQYAQRDGKDLWLRWWRNPDGERHTVELADVEPTRWERTIVVSGATYVYVALRGGATQLTVFDGATNSHVIDLLPVDDASGTRFGVSRLTAPGEVQIGDVTLGSAPTT